MMSLMRPLMVISPVLEARLVARVQPAVGLERARRLRLAPPIAHHHVRPPDHQLVIGADPHFDAVDRLADGRGIVAGRTVDADDRRGLGHAVTLKDVDPHREEQARHRGRHRRAAGDRLAQPAAELSPDLRGDQPIEDRRQRRNKGRRRACALRRQEPAPAQALGQIEQPAGERPLLASSVMDSGVCPLVDARHRDENGRTDCPHVLASCAIERA